MSETKEGHCRAGAWLGLALLALAATGTPAAAAGLPAPDHVVVVILENHAFGQIIGSAEAPYLNELAAKGALLTRASGVAHPSEPNYLALFSGSTWGVRDDGWHVLQGPNLATELRAAGKSFAGFAEPGSPRKHNPWESFHNAVDVERGMAAFPSDFRTLPTVSFVVPDLENDMHDGSVAAGDRWLRTHLGAYAEWCLGHDDLLIVTFDEDDNGHDNHIPALVLGGPVAPGRYDEPVDHYRLLRTIEAFYDLPPLGESAEAVPITSLWKTVGPALAGPPPAR